MPSASYTKSPFRGPMASPEEFVRQLDTPEKIHAYYQSTLGTPLEESLVVSQFTRVILEYLRGHYPKPFDACRPKAFKPGVPEFVALGILIGQMVKHTHVRLDLLEIFKDKPFLIASNRSVAHALSIPLNFAVSSRDHGPHHLSCETIGLIDTCRRAGGQIESLGFLLDSFDTIPAALASDVYNYIRDIYPIVGSMRADQA